MNKIRKVWADNIKVNANVESWSHAKKIDRLRVQGIKGNITAMSFVSFPESKQPGLENPVGHMKDVGIDYERQLQLGDGEYITKVVLRDYTGKNPALASFSIETNKQKQLPQFGIHRERSTILTREMEFDEGEFCGFHGYVQKCAYSEDTRIIQMGVYKALQNSTNEFVKI